MIAVPVAVHVIHKNDSAIVVDACTIQRRRTTCAVHYDLELEYQGKPAGGGTVSFSVAVERSHGRLVMREVPNSALMTLTPS